MQWGKNWRDCTDKLCGQSAYNFMQAPFTDEPYGMYYPASAKAGYTVKIRPDLENCIWCLPIHNDYYRRQQNIAMQQ